MVNEGELNASAKARWLAGRKPPGGAVRTLRLACSSRTISAAISASPEAGAAGSGAGLDGVQVTGASPQAKLAIGQGGDDVQELTGVHREILSRNCLVLSLRGRTAECGRVSSVVDL